MAVRVQVRQADTTDEAFIRCRTYSHAWDEFSPIDLDPPAYGWRLSLRCIRCSTERHDMISYGTGQMLSRRYIYVEGYQTQGEDRPTKEVFREELFIRLRAQLEAHNGLGEEIDAAVIPIRKKATKATTKKTTARKRA